MKRAITLIAVCLMMSHQAFAIFDAQLLVGQTTLKADSDEYSGTRTDVAFHLDPIPLVPIGFGLNLSTQTVEKDGLEIQGVIVSPEIYAWFPFGSFKPYAKIGVALGSKFKGDTMVPVGGVLTKAAVTYDYTGSHIGVGLIYSLVPLVGILLEVFLNLPFALS